MILSPISLDHLLFCVICAAMINGLVIYPINRGLIVNYQSIHKIKKQNKNTGIPLFQQNKTFEVAP